MNSSILSDASLFCRTPYRNTEQNDIKTINQCSSTNSSDISPEPEHLTLLQKPTRGTQAMNSNGAMRLFLRFKKLAILFSISLVIQVFLTVIYYQLSYCGKLQQAQISNYLQIGMTLVSVILRTLMKISKKSWKAAGQIIESQFKPFGLFLNMAIIVIQPYPFFQEIYIENWNFQDQRNFPFKLNYLLVDISLLKLILVFITYMDSFKYRSPKFSHVFVLNNLKNSALFALKYMFRRYPVILVQVFFVGSLLFFSFVYRVNERNALSSTNYFQYYGNCIWAVFITMSTVGYGDVVPVTQIGRLFGLFCTFWGCLLISVMVIATINMFQMDRYEKQALKLLKILNQKKLIKKYSAQYLSYSIPRIFRNKKRKNQSLPDLPISLNQKHVKKLLNEAIKNAYFNEIYLKTLSVEMTRQFQKIFNSIQILTQNSQAILQYLFSLNLIGTVTQHCKQFQFIQKYKSAI